MSDVAPFLDVCGFPGPGDRVELTRRARRVLIENGWTPPKLEEELS